MLLQRMAHRPFILCLTIWITLFPCVATAQQTQTNNITDEILNFVPPCAQDCFRTFISANFNSRICGNSPSLQCLCRQIGSSKYTIGEGGVSCIVGESRFGSCNGRDATSESAGWDKSGIYADQGQAMRHRLHITCVSGFRRQRP